MVHIFRNCPYSCAHLFGKLKLLRAPPPNTHKDLIRTSSPALTKVDNKGFSNP